MDGSVEQMDGSVEQMDGSVERMDDSVERMDDSVERMDDRIRQDYGGVIEWHMKLRISNPVRRYFIIYWKTAS